MITYQSFSSAATKRLARELVRDILTRGTARRAVVVGLDGPLGSGKTTFIQGFFGGLGLRRKALSPTFILMRKLSFRDKQLKTVFHFDLYRIKNQREMLQFGFKEIIRNPHNIVLIEWANKLKKVLPPTTIWLEFEHGSKENERLIKSNIKIQKSK